MACRSQGEQGARDGYGHGWPVHRDLGFAGHLAGFGASLLVAALGAIGFVSGRFADADGELGDFFHGREHGNRRR